MMSSYVVTLKCSLFDIFLRALKDIFMISAWYASQDTKKKLQ